jgi:hypothetical protein
VGVKNVEYHHVLLTYTDSGTEYHAVFQFGDNVVAADMLARYLKDTPNLRVRRRTEFQRIQVEDVSGR